MSQDITHDAARQRYSLIVDGVEAYLTYERRQPGVRHITHTIVPDAIGGRGLGKKLVTAIMNDIKAGGEAVLKPGGLHVMMIDLKAPMKEGDLVPITLKFDDGSSKQVDAKVVRPVAAPAPMPTEHGQKH